MIKTVLSQCFLIQIVDDEGNELECEYYFGTEEEAEKRSKQILKDFKRRGRIYNENN